MMFSQKLNTHRMSRRLAKALIRLRVIQLTLCGMWPCWSHIHYCWKSPAAAQIIIIQLAPLFTSMLYQNLEIILTFKNANIADLNEMPQSAGT